MHLDEALHTFLEESRELLADMENSLLRVLQESQPQESINAIFRAAHTIKGSAGLFGLDTVVDFTHVAENLLEEIRTGDVKLDEVLVQLLLECCDHMHAMVHAVEQRSDLHDAHLVERSQALIKALQEHSHSYVQAGSSENHAPAITASNGTKEWHIAVRFGPSVLQNGMDPLSFVRYLHTLGEIWHTETLYEQLPNLLNLDAEQCYLGYILHMRTRVSQAELEAVFEFVRDDCELCISPWAALANSPRAEPLGDGTNLQCTPSALCPPASASPTLHALDTGDSRICPTPSLAAESPLSASSTPSATSSKPRPAEIASVRVDAHKLDQLIDLVGELIIASAGANEVAQKMRSTALVEANAAVSTLVEQVRDQALQLRMVKIGGTFNKFQRVVHEISRELGKTIVLEVSGEDTELDKTVVERIADPLTHLVRNAMDHGIESAQERVLRGKPAHGTVRLNAYHESGHVVMEISDDGGGLNRERILAKGLERGCVDPVRTLSDKEIFNLIFEPGFSTAAQVTNLSGRGVGMDVVRSNITALRGTVELDSVPGQGTTVQVRLPLTLAIIVGFQVRVGHSVFVIPLEMVDECVEYTKAGAQHYTDLRGSVLPFVALRQHFGLQGPRSTRPNIVVIKHGSQRFGLLVDELLGEAQTVIKPLSRLFSHAHGISGSSILGNGSVALILDVPALHTQLLAQAQADTQHRSYTAQ